MTHQIAYISYNDDDHGLKERSMTILDDFFVDDKFQIINEPTGIIFVASGGCEQAAIKLTENLNNITLLCHRESNSYAATMEIASYLRDRGSRVSIIDVFASGAYSEFIELKKVNKAIDELSGQKSAAIGVISDWLINSDIEESIVKEKLGIELLRLPWEKLDDYRKEDSSKEFLSYFPDFDNSELLDTAKVYSLLEKVIGEYDISAITVECFSMVMKDKVTACLPLAVLNTKNTVAACEGDVCSMIGSMIIRAISGVIPWQANVAEIKDNTILFAHCTAPLNLLKSYNITTHFETNCGTAIQGEFIIGKVGVFRINNKLDKYMLLEGEVVDTPTHSFACRTQINFRTTSDQSNLLKNSSLGNHQLIFPAEYIPLVNKMMKQLNIVRVM